MTPPTGFHAVGPIQVVAVGFESLDRFRGQILEEIEELSAGAAARVLDVLAVVKEANGDLVALDLEDLGFDDLDEADEALGTMLGELVGFTVEGGGGQPPTDEIVAASGIGLTIDDIQRIGDNLEPGTAAGFLLIEHRWAIGLRDAIRTAGGEILAQGFLSRDGILLVGEELAAVSEAIEAIELADAAQAEAVLRTLEASAVIETAAEIEAAVAAQTIRVLAEAGIIQQAAIDGATRAVFDAELIAASQTTNQGTSS